MGRCTKHKVQKELDESIFDDVGRAVHGHQSMFDLKICLAATGAVMQVGCTVNSTVANSISLWWAPQKPWTEADQLKMCAIFHDITEMAHLTPAECASLFRGRVGASAAQAAAKAASGATTSQRPPRAAAAASSATTSQQRPPAGPQAKRPHSPDRAPATDGAGQFISARNFNQIFAAASGASF